MGRKVEKNEFESMFVMKKTPRIMFNTYLAVSFLAVSWRGKLIIEISP